MTSRTRTCRVLLSLFLGQTAAGCTDHSLVREHDSTLNIHSQYDMSLLDAPNVNRGPKASSEISLTQCSGSRIWSVAIDSDASTAFVTLQTDSSACKGIWMLTFDGSKCERITLPAGLDAPVDVVASGDGSRLLAFPGVLTSSITPQLYLLDSHDGTAIDIGKVAAEHMGARPDAFGIQGGASLSHDGSVVAFHGRDVAAGVFRSFVYDTHSGVLAALGGQKHRTREIQGARVSADGTSVFAWSDEELFLHDVAEQAARRVPLHQSSALVSSVKVGDDHERVLYEPLSSKDGWLFAEFGLGVDVTPKPILVDDPWHPFRLGGHFVVDGGLRRLVYTAPSVHDGDEGVFVTDLETTDTKRIDVDAPYQGSVYELRPQISADGTRVVYYQPAGVTGDAVEMAPTVYRVGVPD